MASSPFPQTLLEFPSVLEFGLGPTAAVLTRGFSDYFVNIPFTTAGLLQIARTDAVDLTASRVVLHADAPVGAALVARRGWTSRLAGMSLVPEARRQGIGRATVDRLLAEAAAREERAMILEVIEQNAPAVRLYERCGFRRIRRLVGFAKTRDEELSSPEPVDEIDLRTMGAAVTAMNVPDLPWQVSGETLAHAAPPSHAYQFDGAAVALSNLATGDVTIRGLAFDRSPAGIHTAATLLRNLSARFPSKRWQIKAVWPEEFSEVFIRAGFERTELTQWQMIRALTGAA